MWRSPEVTNYDDEAALQALVAESPELLGAAGKRAVVRELTVPGVGSLDLAAVDPTGALTLVECKLAANSEIRRSVIGQVFAYAAGLWSLSYDAFDRHFAARAGQPLAAAVAACSGLGDCWDQEAFRSTVAANLETGRFDLVIAVDSITDELKQVVRYLNEHTVSEIRVLALELGYVADGDIEVLVPTVYGEESATRKAQVSRRVWDEASLFDALDRLCPEGRPVIERLYHHAVCHGDGFYWGDGASPSVTAYYRIGDAQAPVWSCYTRPKTSSWDLNWEWMHSRQVPETALVQLAGRMRAIPGVAARLQGLEDAGWRKRPSLPIAALLAVPGVVDQVILALDELLGTNPRGGGTDPTSWPHA